MEVPAGVDEFALTHVIVDETDRQVRHQIGVVLEAIDRRGDDAPERAVADSR